MATQRMVYAVMRFGGFLGLGGHVYTVPWAKLNYDPELGGFHTDITEAELQDAAHLPHDSDRDQEREMGKGRRDLERAHDTAPRDLCRLEVRDVLVLVEDPSVRGCQELREKVEERGLPGAVRPDHRVDVAPLDAEVHVLHGHEA
jgi:hypothetical protein